MSCDIIKLSNVYNYGAVITRFSIENTSFSFANVLLDANSKFRAGNISVIHEKAFQQIAVYIRFIFYIKNLNQIFSFLIRLVNKWKINSKILIIDFSWEILISKLDFNLLRSLIGLMDKLKILLKIINIY